ncbi:polysaccharide pyruvyl transferase CsaB [Marinibacterium anthonyi]|nr:polysaccharide pyruvyl transferase CsaB [Marinibacterium anthonyi]
MTKVVQFGVPFSPNLGDGVISDCLEYGLRVSQPGIELKRVDLSGRQGFGDVIVSNRAQIIRILELLPAPVRRTLVSARLGRILDQVEPEWQKAIADADLAIVGGGQLFSDADLNFCLKIARASALLRDANVPVAIHAVGVARNWSPRGGDLFAKVLATDLRAIGLRDAPSISAWLQQMSGQPGADRAPQPELTRDPGLLAAGCYGAAPWRGGIGIGVTATEILAYHADDPKRAALDEDFFASLAIALSERGHKVSLFCNGAAEDQAVLSRLAEKQDLTRRGVQVIPAPRRPAELARMIGGFDAVIAHRLHACILSYAYLVPVVGLGWDGKVESFFASVGRQEHFVPVADVTTQTVLSHVDHCLAKGIDGERHAQVLREAQGGIDRMLAACTGRPVATTRKLAPAE